MNRKKPENKKPTESTDFSGKKMKCSNCQAEAVTYVNWKDKHYCANHFKRYFLAQLGKVLDKYEINGKVAVALSGGKDSSTCVETLTHFDRIDVEPFYIDLGIDEYSQESMEREEELSDKLDVNLNVIDFEDEYGTTIPELNEKESGSACGLCGMIKRYLMNKHAYENDFDHIATGHNLSDEISSTFNNLANVYLTPFRGMKPVLEDKEEYKMVSRIKPLFFLTDKECLIYAETNDIPFYHKECPLSTGSPTNQLKDWLHELNEERAKILRNFAKSFMRIEERMEIDQSELKNCDNCGYPTATQTCRFCRVVRNQSE